MAAQAKASLQEVLEAGRALQPEGLPVTGARLRGRLGCGRPDRLAELWEQASADLEAEPVTEVLPERLVNTRDQAVTALGELVGRAVMQAYSDAWHGAEQVLDGRSRAESRAAQSVEANLRSEIVALNDLLEVADARSQAQAEQRDALTVKLQELQADTDASETARREMLACAAQRDDAMQGRSLAEARLLASQEEVVRWRECQERVTAELMRVSTQAAIERAQATTVIEAERQRADRAEVERADLQLQVASLNKRVARGVAAKSVRRRRPVLPSAPMPEAAIP